VQLERGHVEVGEVAELELDLVLPVLERLGRLGETLGASQQARLLLLEPLDLPEQLADRIVAGELRAELGVLVAELSFSRRRSSVS
jgi:hypothetical protein